MSKKFWKASIDDTQNDGCTDFETKALMDVFENVMRNIAATLVRKAEFDLSDFQLSGRDVGHFKLTMTRTEHRQVEQWTGLFTAEGKTLKVLGMLERD